MAEDHQRNDGWTCKGNAYFEAFYKGLGIVSEDEWDAFMTSAKNPLPVSLRITGFRSEAKAMLDIIEREYLTKLESENKDATEKGTICEFTRLPWYPDGLALQLQMDRRTIRRTPLYQRFHEMLISETEAGGISRQETVSMIPPLLLDVKPCHSVLDMCAAPGSKTAQILEMLHSDEDTHGMALAQTRGFVIANDCDAKRCQLMVHQLKRLQSPLMSVTCHDAATFPALRLADGSPINFDRVLCDVPCSGDGTVRKNPIIWKRWSLTQGASLHKLQSRILKRGLEVLRSDGQGRLIYSTCSLNPAEDEAVVASVLMAGGDSLRLVDISDRLPGLKTRPGLTNWSYVTQDGQKMQTFEDVPQVLRRSFGHGIFCPENLDRKIAEQLKRCIRILPHDNDTGGFFVAVFEKNGKLGWQKSMHPLALAAGEAGKQAENDAEEEAAKKPKIEDSNESEVKGEQQGEEKPKGGRGQQRKVRKPFMNEAPLIWLQEGHDDWKQIRDFFKLETTGNDGTYIPPNCLCSRTEGSRRRIFFLVSPRIRAIIQSNEHLRPICVGVRCFARSSSPNSQCDFRICQDCVHVLQPYVRARLIELSTKKDAVLLLSSERGPYNGRLSSAVGRQLESIDVGTCIFRLALEGFEVLMAGWRGKATCRVFVAKYERSHFLRLCGIHSNDRKGKFGKGSDENENGEENEAEGKEEEEGVKSGPEEGDECKCECDCEGEFEDNKEPDTC